MKKTTLVTVGLVLGIAALLFLFCKDPGEDRSSPRLVVLSRLWSVPHEKEFVIREVITPFEQINNCRVDFQTLSDSDLFKRVRVQNDSGHVSSDVVIVYVSRMREWIDAGYVQDLTGHMASWSDRTFFEAFMPMTIFKGKRYFLPIGADDYLLCANRKALPYLPEGADPKALTWTQFADWSLKIRRGEGAGKLAVTGIAQKALIYQLSAITLSYGGGFPDISSSEAVEGWKLLIRMKEAFSPTVRTYDSVIAPMKRGETWLTVAHCAHAGEIYSSNPTQFVVAPAPRGPAGIGSVAGFSGFAVLKGAAQPDLGFKFLEYMTQPDIQVKLAKGTGGFIPTVTEAHSFIGDARQDLVIKNALFVLEKGKLAYIPVCGNWAGVKQIFDEAFDKLVLQDGRLDLDYLQRQQSRLDIFLEPGP